jgi:hypothetical protein
MYETEVQHRRDRAHLIREAGSRLDVPVITVPHIVVYYETIKREVKIKPISECRCDERLKTQPEESTRLSDTGLFGELEHLKIKVRLIDERFVSVMGECVIER